MGQTIVRRMRRVSFNILTSILLIGITVSCELTEDDPIDEGPVSHVSLFQVSPDAPNFDILIDDEKINNVPFEYDKPTGYLKFSPGVRNLKIRPYGGGTPFIDTNITLEPDEPFSIFLADDFADLTVLQFFDNLETPPSGKARVRFINLSPDSETVQLKIKDDDLPLTVGQSFKDASEFMTIDAGLIDFEILSGGNVIYDLPDSPMENGWFYTIYVIGYVEPPSGNTNELKAQVFIH